MSAINTLEKVVRVILKTHPDPTAPVQDLYNNSTDERERAEIEVIAWSFGIKICEEKKGKNI